MTPLASVAMLEKLALLKMALCRAPALSVPSERSLVNILGDLKMLLRAALSRRSGVDLANRASAGTVRRQRTKPALPRSWGFQLCRARAAPGAVRRRFEQAQTRQAPLI